MKVEKVKISSLELDPENSRKHSLRNLEAISSSLTQFGQQKPIVVHGNTVIAGNGTLAAMHKLGWEEVVITRVPKEWNSAQASAYAIADNRTSELASWEEESLLETLRSLQDSELFDATGFSEYDVDDLSAFLEELESKNPSIPDSSNESKALSLSEEKENYDERGTRSLVLSFPNSIYVWAVEKLIDVRIEKNVDTNAQAILELLSERIGEEYPKWNMN